MFLILLHFSLYNGVMNKKKIDYSINIVYYEMRYEVGLEPETDPRWLKGCHLTQVKVIL